MGTDRSWRGSKLVEVCWQFWHWMRELSCPSNSRVSALLALGTGWPPAATSLGALP